MSMWNFKAGDKAFCVWPKKDIGLEGGEHILRSVEGNYVTIEGISLYLQNWRFMKVAEMPPKPEPPSKLKMEDIPQFGLGCSFGNYGHGL